MKRQYMDCNYWFYEKIIINIYLLESELIALNEVFQMIIISGSFDIILINYVNDFLCLNQMKIFSLITYEWHDLEHKMLYFRYSKTMKSMLWYILMRNIYCEAIDKTTKSIICCIRMRIINIIWSLFYMFYLLVGRVWNVV